MGGTIGLVLMGITILFILSGIFWGAVRGLKKSGFRLSWNIAIGVILFFITPSITGAILTTDISFLNIQISGVTAQNLNFVLSELLQSNAQIAAIIGTGPEAVNIISGFITLFANSVVFVLVFWLAKILLWPIWAMLASLLMPDKTARGEKLNKHKGYGMIVGAVSGLLIGATTVMPVVGTLNLAQDLNNSYAETLNNDGFVTDLLPADVNTIYYEYVDGVGNQVLTYTGVNAFGSMIFNGLSQADINGTTVSLEQELNNAILTYGMLNKISVFDYSNITQETADELLNLIDQLIDNVFAINTTTVVLDSFMPQIVDQILNNPDFMIQLPDTGDATLNDGIRQMVEELADVNSAQIKAELKAAVKIASVLNRVDVLVPLLNGTVVDTDTLLAKIDEQAIKDVTDALFEMQTIAVTLPIVVNTGLEYLANAINVLEFEVNGESVTIAEIKDMFQVITVAALDLYNSLDFNSTIYITDNSLSYVGVVLDELMGYKGLSETSKTNLVNALEGEAKKYLEEFKASFDPNMAGILDQVILAIDNLSNVQSFETELGYLSKAVMEFENLSNAVETSDYEKLLSSTGLVLNQFEKTTTFGGTVNTIVSEALDMVSSMLGTTDLDPIILEIKNAINNAPADLNWQTELELFAELFNTAQTITTTTNIDTDLFSADSTMLADIGKALDNLEKGKLFNGSANGLVTSLFTIMESYTTGEMKTLISDIKATIPVAPAGQTEANSIVWEDEFDALKTLGASVTSYMETGSTLTLEAVGNAIDAALYQSKVLLTKATVNTYIDQVISDLKTDYEVGGSQENADFVTVLNTIITNIDDIVSYGIEFKHLDTLINTINNNLSGSADSYDFGTLGTTLDGFNGSILITGLNGTNDVRPSFINLAIDQIAAGTTDADLDAILLGMKTNTSSIVYYQNELNALKQLIDLANNTSAVESFDFAGLGATLDSFGNANLIAGDGTAATTDVRPQFIVMALNKVATSSLDADVLTIIENIKTNATTNTIASYEEELTHLKTMIDRATSGKDSLDNQSGSFDTTVFTTFGAELDSFAGSALLDNQRDDIVNYMLTHVVINTATTEVNTVVNNILNNLRTISASIVADTSNLTYTILFTELVELNTHAQSISGAAFSTTESGLAGFGTTLNVMQNMEIVNVTDTAELGVVVLNKLKTAIADPSYTPEEVADLPIYTETVAQIDAQIAAYQAATEVSVIDFEADFTAIDTKVSELIAAINLIP